MLLWIFLQNILNVSIFLFVHVSCVYIFKYKNIISTWNFYLATLLIQYQNIYIFNRRSIQMHDRWYLLHHAGENFQGASEGSISCSSAFLVLCESVRMPSTYSRLTCATVQPTVHIYYCKLYTAGILNNIFTHATAVCGTVQTAGSHFFIQHKYPFDVFGEARSNASGFTSDWLPTQLTHRHLIWEKHGIRTCSGWVGCVIKMLMKALDF